MHSLMSCTVASSKETHSQGSSESIGLKFSRMSVVVLDAWAALADAFAVVTAHAESARLATGDPEILALPRGVISIMPLQRT